MAPKREITAHMARQLLDYDPVTGLFRHKVRTSEMFADGGYSAERKCAAWNGKNAGTPAGSLNDKGYLTIRMFGRLYRAHRIARLIMTGEQPPAEIDHENLCKGDNRWANIRDATRSQNQGNHRLRCTNTSGFKGVSWAKRDCKWEARIKVNGKTIFLGYFDTREEAAAAYATAAIKYFGEYARAS